jgi:thiol-disulfide isomerase/thioredoxin
VVSKSSGCRVRTAGVLVAAIALAACAGGTSPQAADLTRAVESPGVSRIAPAERRIAPNLSGATLAGPAFALDDVAGNVVVVNVWASWCAPCRVESPVLALLEHELATQKVRFVGIDETDTTTSAKRFVASVGARYPQLVDSDGTLLRQLPLLPQKGIPSTLILDRHHRVAARVIGPATREQIQMLVRELLQED